MNKKLSNTLKIRLMSSFLQNVITAAFLPFMAIFLSNLINETFSGLFLSISVLIGIPASFIGGYLIENLNKRKLILSYQIIMAIALLVMGIALLEVSKNVLVFCMSYLVFTIAWSFDHPAINTIIMDAVTSENENFIFKITYWLSNLSMAIGLFAGGFLYKIDHAVIMFISSLVFFSTYIMLRKGILDNDAPQSKKESLNILNMWESYIIVFKNKRYIMLIVSFGIIMMAELSTSSYVAVRLSQTFSSIKIFSVDIDGVSAYSLLMLLNTFSVIAFTYLLTNLSSEMKENRRLIVGFILYSIGYINITYLNNFYLLMVFMFFSAIGEILYAPIVEEASFRITPEDKRGTYLGVRNLSYHLAELLARLGIILGTFLSPKHMAGTLFLLLLISTALMYKAIYLKVTNQGI